MKIVYIEETSFEQLLDEIDPQDFFKENKLIILSKFPHAAIPDCSGIYKNIQQKNLDNNIMYIALGNLAYVLNRKRVEILNYGPSFNEKDLIEFPIKYYQKKENKKVTSISFYYQHFYNSPHFSIERLNSYLHEIGLSNKELLEYVDIDFRKSRENSVIDPQKRKMIFVPHYDIFWDIERIEETLKMYLEAGNFLTLLTFTGNHYGFPFSVNIGDVLDTKNYENEYQKLIKFFNTLNIEADQVSNFKTSYTGINFRESCYNFGYSHNNMNPFFEIWLEYLKSKGYNIDEVYFIGQPTNDFNMPKEIKAQYLLDHISTQDEFAKVVKEKILK